MLAVTSVQRALYNCPFWQRHACCHWRPTEGTSNYVSSHELRTTCWPDHQHLRPANYHVVHSARSSNCAMRSHAFTSIAPPAATRAKRTCNTVGRVCKRERCAHQGSRLQPPSRQARQHTCSDTAMFNGNVQCSMFNGQAPYPPAGSHATRARWHLLWHSLEAGMWDRIMLLHKMKAGTQDIPKSDALEGLAGDLADAGRNTVHVEMLADHCSARGLPGRSGVWGHMLRGSASNNGHADPRSCLSA